MSSGMRDSYAGRMFAEGKGNAPSEHDEREEPVAYSRPTTSWADDLRLSEAVKAMRALGYDAETLNMLSDHMLGGEAITPPEQAEGGTIFDTHERLAPDAVEAARYVIATARWISDETDEDPAAIEKTRVGADLLHRLVDAAARPTPVSGTGLLEREDGWLIEEGVRCVSCPDCAFTFDATHTDDGSDSYTCPNCAPDPYECDLCSGSAHGAQPTHDEDCPVGIARAAIERHEGGEHG